MSLKIDGHFYKNAYVIVKMILKQKIWHSGTVLRIKSYLTLCGVFNPLATSLRIL